MPQDRHTLLDEILAPDADGDTEEEVENFLFPLPPIPWQSLLQAGRAVEDHTAHGWKPHRKKTRPASQVDALVLHQMAFSRGNDPARYRKVNSHYIITPDGRIVQHHPVTAYLWASNYFNSRSVAVEFAGNFPSLRGRCWKPEKYGCHALTDAQAAAGRDLLRHLKRTLGITHVFAHRQASNTRSNCCGPDIWYRVGQWGVDTLGLSDGGPGWHHPKAGEAIPEEWRRPRPR